MAKLEPTKTTPDKKAKLPVLVSYAYLREAPEERQAYIMQNPHIELLVDSGAFSALNAGKEIKLDEYMDFIQRWQEHIFGYVALDVLGDPKATDENLRIMLKEGLSPVPVHVLGDDGKRMDELFELSDWVACGGLRRPHRGWAPPAYVKQKMVWAKGRNVHWLGYTRDDMVRAFKPYSCDSANAFSGAMYGLTILFHREAGGRKSQARAQHAAVETTPRTAQLLMRDCGMPVEWWKDVDRWKSSKDRGREFGSVTCMIACGAMVEFSRWVRETTGTRYFLAVNEGSHYDVLAWWANETRPDRRRKPYEIKVLGKGLRVPKYYSEDRPTLVDPTYEELR